ncbi:MAG: hypothetical protein ACRCUM_00055 [Mycoplasmoidaceae bacterium]
MKTGKTKYFLIEDTYFQIPYNKFIKAKRLGGEFYIAKINRSIFSFSSKIYIQEKQNVLCKVVRYEAIPNIVYLKIVSENGVN